MRTNRDGLMVSRLRLVQCSGRIVRGSAKGDRCRRTILMKVDKHDNTRLWKCIAHVTQK